MTNHTVNTMTPFDCLCFDPPSDLLQLSPFFAGIAMSAALELVRVCWALGTGRGHQLDGLSRFPIMFTGMLIPLCRHMSWCIFTTLAGMMVAWVVGEKSIMGLRKCGYLGGKPLMLHSDSERDEEYGASGEVGEKVEEKFGYVEWSEKSGGYVLKA